MCQYRNTLFTEGKNIITGKPVVFIMVLNQENILKIMNLHASGFKIVAIFYTRLIDPHILESNEIWEDILFLVQYM